jgi:hypothetical protein
VPFDNVVLFADILGRLSIVGTDHHASTSDFDARANVSIGIVRTARVSADR